MPVHRIALRGSGLSEAAKRSLRANGVHWMASREAPGEQPSHLALIDACDADQAIAKVRGTLNSDAWQISLEQV